MLFRSPPELLQLEASYSLQARRRRLEGTVVYNVYVTTTGNITEVILIISSGYNILDEAASVAVQSASYKPGTVDGFVEVSVTYVLT